MLTRRSFSALFPLLLYPPSLWADDGEKRIALVIGNTLYEDRERLPNATLDAKKMAQVLCQLEFEVDCVLDTSRDTLADALAQFGKKAQQFGPKVVTFFYYSGHAAQDIAQINYLIPVEATVETPDELRSSSVPLQEVFIAINAANNSVNIVVLDACRDWFYGDTSIDANKGLYDIGRQGNMMLVTATSPGATAGDGGTDGSPFSRRLVEALSTTPEEPLALLFDDVQGKVYADTGGEQIPDWLDGLAQAPRWAISPKAKTVDFGLRLNPRTSHVPLSPTLENLDRSKLLVFTNGKTSVVDALTQRRDILADAEIDTPLRLSYFLGTLSFESSNFRFLQENPKFSASVLQSLFPSKFPNPDIAAQYAFQPERIANRVYAGLGGNSDENSGDGWHYRARGFFALTGKARYRQIGELIGVDLFKVPEVLNDPVTDLAACAKFWQLHKANEAADKEDLPEVARIISGVARQLDQRRVAISKATQAIRLN